MTKLKSILFGATALAFSASGAMAQEVTLNMHQFLPAQANVPKLILSVWADRIEAESEGRIKIERFDSMALGGTPPELLDQAVDGIADIVWTVVGYTPGRFPETEVFELPFMVEDARAASCAYWKMYDKNMRDDFKDVHILEIVAHIFVVHFPVRARCGACVFYHEGQLEHFSLGEAARRVANNSPDDIGDAINRLVQQFWWCATKCHGIETFDLDAAFGFCLDPVRPDRQDQLWHVGLCW